MAQSTTRIETAHARRYMVQLCKHFGHKRPIRFDDETGSVSFDAGEARMTAEPDALAILVEAPDAESAARLSQVMESHLKRFSFREPDLAVAWLAKP